MNEKTAERIDLMTRDQRQKRFDELNRNFVMQPHSTSGGQVPLASSLEDLEERDYLKKKLGNAN
jgi:hypothetical protein